MSKKNMMVMLSLVMAGLAAVYLLPRVPVESPQETDAERFFESYHQAIETVRASRGAQQSQEASGDVVADIIARTAKAHRISWRLTRITSVQAELDLGVVNRTRLLRWLAQLRVDHGLHISSIKVADAPEPGDISVSRLVLLKGSAG